MHPVPGKLARTMHELFGAAAVEWLRRLPDLIAECEQRWSLQVLPPFPDLSINYVAPVLRAGGSPAVLKLGVPNPELLTEIAALRLYGGNGIVQLLDADPGLGAILLERLLPGVPLSALEDDRQATSIGAGVMRQLWRPLPAEHPFPTVAKWADGLKKLRREFGGGTGPFPAPLVAQAEALFSELLASQTETVLLHGDLHHDNILTAQRQPWLALDPKGVAGEPGYEVGAFLHNPGTRLLRMPQPSRILARRLDQLAEELDLDRQRLASWGLAHTVLSAWWSYEDQGYGWESAIAYAGYLSSLIRNGM